VIVSIVTLRPDAVIEVRLKTTDEGGRQGAIVVPEGFSMGRYCCPLFVDGEAFDCCFLSFGKSLLLGETYQVPIKFLCPELVLPKLVEGKSITLWEGKDIGIGQVVLVNRDVGQ
jgi:hypothetical protein